MLCRRARDGGRRKKCGKNNNALALVRQKCNAQNTCVLQATSSIYTFKDQCRRGSAYLRVQYRCVKGRNSYNIQMSFRFNIMQIINRLSLLIAECRSRYEADIAVYFISSRKGYFRSKQPQIFELCGERTSYIICMFCRSLFVLLNFFLLAIVLSVLLRYTDSDYPFGIFEPFIYSEKFRSGLAFGRVCIFVWIACSFHVLHQRYLGNHCLLNIRLQQQNVERKV